MKNRPLNRLIWARADWSRTNKELVALLDVSLFTVRKYRHIYTGETTSGSTNPLNNVTGWEHKSNAAVAVETGLGRQAVSDWRCRKKLPKGPRSPGTGYHRKNAARKPVPMTLHARAKRLEAVWAFLWPDDPQNLLQRDEVETIKTLIQQNQTS